MIEKKRGSRLLAKQRSGVIFHTLITLFNDHFTLGQDILFIKVEVDHTVRFHLHHQIKAICRNALEIGSEILAGKGIIAASVFGHHARKFPSFQRFGLFEQQMFEKMGNPRHAGRLIRRSGTIPKHMHHNRRSVVFDHHHLQAIFECKISDLISNISRRKIWNRPQGRDC